MDSKLVLPQPLGPDDADELALLHPKRMSSMTRRFPVGGMVRERIRARDTATAAAPPCHPHAPPAGRPARAGARLAAPPLAARAGTSRRRASSSRTRDLQTRWSSRRRRAPARPARRPPSSPAAACRTRRGRNLGRRRPRVDGTVALDGLHQHVKVGAGERTAPPPGRFLPTCASCTHCWPR